MKRVTIPLVLLVGAVASTAATVLLLPTSHGGAQAPKARPQWEYAALILEDASASLSWDAGRTTLAARGDVTRPDPDRAVKDLYRQMGGKEEGPTFGVLLNLIGQDGWEMFSYVHPSGVQVYRFKRACQ